MAQDSSGLTLCSEPGCCCLSHFPGAEAETLQTYICGPRVSSGIVLKQLSMRSYEVGLRAEEPEQVRVCMALEFMLLRLESWHCPCD